MIRVFVYGTLMRNGYNHQAFLSGKKYLGSAILKGFEIFNLGSFPGIAAHLGERVKGEVFEIDESTLKRLDMLEGNGYLYSRQKVEVEIQDGSPINVWVYVWNGQVNHKNKISFQDQPWINFVERNAL